MKKALLLCVVLSMLLLVGCSSVKDTDAADIPSEDNVSTTVPTTTADSVLGDSVFDDPQYGDKKPIKTEDPSDSTVPEQDSTVGDTENEQDKNDNSSGNGNGSTELPAPGTLSYEDFIKLTPEQQQAYQESYGLDEAGLQAFFKWYSEAKAAYEKEHPPEEIPSDGKIDLG